ncbi:MAG: hypothetical protein ACR2L9_06050, partial [Solirubrobacteraceae bacterium]
MSTSGIPVIHGGERSGRTAQRRRPPTLDHGVLLRRLLTIVVLALCVVTVLLAVPDLWPVVRELSAMNPGPVAAAVALEL